MSNDMSYNITDDNTHENFCDNTFGLQLTDNSKTGWAFSMPRRKTCIYATPTCRRLCYANGIRFRARSQTEKRLRNYRTVEYLLSQGGPELLSENLIMLIDNARPSDWLVASVADRQPATPWTLRIHDAGDFHSASYARAWTLAASRRPQCAFWFYTRSFPHRPIFQSLTDFAALPNCSGWLSIDADNYTEGLAAYASASGIWKVALLQTAVDTLPPPLLPALRSSVRPGDLVNFPYHRGRYHVEPIEESPLFTCPAVLGTYKLERNANKPRPCQSCTFCLPA